MAHFTGNKHIKRILYEALTDNHIWDLRSILTGKPLVYYFGEDFADEYMQTRIINKVALKSLRLTEKRHDKKRHKNFDFYMKEVKHVPMKIKEKWNWVFIWDDNVAIFDLDNLKCEMHTGGKEFERYDQMFNEIWENN